ncbi:MAG: phosphotransferase [Actinomycetota bacterium]|nr:phosphotransferase [Actinomycetota bacterium]
MKFEERSVRGQVARLRPTALEALRAYPIEVTGLRLLQHGFNTTFRVDTADGTRYALRVNVNSRRTEANIAAEMAWLAALATDTELWVPTPQRTRDGALMTHVFSPDLGRELPAALFAWLPGRTLGTKATREQMRATGRATAILHQHGAQWRMPDGAGLPAIDTILMDVPDNLSGEHRLLDDDAHAVIDAATAQIQGHYDTLFAGAARQPLHADLHIWNLHWYRGRLAVFDFDDSGIGVPVQDLSISAYYIRDNLAQEAALLDGYQEVRPLPSFTTDQYEAMVASRNLVLLNDIVTTTNAEFLAILDRYVPRSITKLRAYLDTGVFRHDVPGLVPISD